MRPRQRNRRGNSIREKVTGTSLDKAVWKRQAQGSPCDACRKKEEVNVVLHIVEAFIGSTVRVF